MSLLNELNDKQREAASKVEGALLILAGAGSGKTRTLTYRIAYMIKELGISPYSILAVTFTNKAAKEMRERLENLVGEDAIKATVSTFHSFGVKLLRMYGAQIGYNANFTIYDADDQKKIVKTISKELSLNEENTNDRLIVSTISKLKEEGKSPLDYEKENTHNPTAALTAEIYRRYNEKLKASNAMDFSDILLNTMKLLEIPALLEKIQNKYKYVMVDEYQDTNEIQYKIIEKIASESGNICVVGDENQSIYGFRGANIQNILNFEKDYPDALVVKLEENYRSTSIILEAANKVIKNNKSSKDKTLWTKKNGGDLIKIIESYDARDEVNKVIELIAKEKNAGRKYKDMTILYRTNAQSRLFEEGFMRYGISYKIFGGMQFYMRAEVKDIIAYLAVINNSLDDFNLTRIINVPKRKIGLKTLEKLNEYARENQISLFEVLEKSAEIKGISQNVAVTLINLHSMLQELIKLSEYEPVSVIFDKVINNIYYLNYLKENYEDSENRIQNIEELKSSISEMENLVEDLTLREYLENVSLVSATDDLNENQDYIKLMTIHNSKGLEFPIVFLVGVENEIFPGSSFLDEKLLEEERRLCYVAITRAEEKLFICYARERIIYGDRKFMSKSMFIEEIPHSLREDLVKKSEIYNRNKVTEKIVSKNYISNSDLNKTLKDCPYNIGEKLMHKKFGIGVVKDINSKKITMNFIDGDRDIAIVLADKFLSKL